MSFLIITTTVIDQMFHMVYDTNCKEIIICKIMGFKVER